MTSTPYRWAAAALVASAVLTVTGYVLHPAVEPAAMRTPPWVLSHGLLWLGAVAAVAGLAGLYLRQREQIATLGAAGASLAAFGLVALSGAYFYEAIIVPALTADASSLMQTFPSGPTWRPYLATVAASGLLVTLGFVLLGVAMYRVAVLPRWATVLASLGAAAAGVQFLLPAPVGMLAFLTLGVGLTGLGHALWNSVPEPGPRRAAVEPSA